MRDAPTSRAFTGFEIGALCSLFSALYAYILVFYHFLALFLTYLFSPFAISARLGSRALLPPLECLWLEFHFGPATIGFLFGS